MRNVPGDEGTIVPTAAVRRSVFRIDLPTQRGNCYNGGGISPPRQKPQYLLFLFGLGWGSSSFLSPAASGLSSLNNIRTPPHEATVCRPINSPLAKVHVGYLRHLERHHQWPAPGSTNLIELTTLPAAINALFSTGVNIYLGKQALDHPKLAQV